MTSALTLNTLPQAWQALLEDFDHFTPIQLKSYDLIKSGHSLLASSPTGSGKTLAYLLPLLTTLKPGGGQQALILAPNSELAGQIFDVFRPFGEALGIKGNLIVSGSSIKRQLERLKKGPELIVATPGRALEFVKDKKIKMTKITKIVLDEVDNLLEASQLRFVKPILTRTHTDKQLLAFSATAQRQQDLFAQLCPIFKTLIIETSHDQVQHVYLAVEKRKRLDTLRQLAHLAHMRGIVFFNRLEDLGNAEEKLQYQGIAAVSIASDVAGRFRKTIIDKFKQGEITLLLATDIAARGIDIEDLDYVINFDVPVTLESYTHRAGRTGRMGKSGQVINLTTHAIDLKQLKKYHSQAPAYLKAGQILLDT